VKFQEIKDYEEAIEFLHDDLRASTLFKTWIPRERFIELLHSEGGISMFREDTTPIAFAIGANPPIRDSWKKMSIERGASVIDEISAKEREDWETYYMVVPRDPVPYTEPRVRADAEIDSFLKQHAPKSSVFPGNKEIVEWVRVDRNIAGKAELLGVAAICRWESGEHVVASVATHSEMRGEGIGVEVMRQTLAVAQRNSIPILCLGVMSNNHSAIALYKRSGWQELVKFTFIERE
jgi:ribosomal protein S18 acetylase RimI-like enzyme